MYPPSSCHLAPGPRAFDPALEREEMVGLYPPPIEHPPPFQHLPPILYFIGIRYGHERRRRECAEVSKARDSTVAEICTVRHEHVFIGDGRNDQVIINLKA